MLCSVRKLANSIWRLSNWRLSPKFRPARLTANSALTRRGIRSVAIRASKKSSLLWPRSGIDHGLHGHSSDFARDWLERAVDERTPWLPELEIDPMWDALRSQPRFAALLKKMGLEK